MSQEIFKCKVCNRISTAPLFLGHCGGCTSILSMMGPGRPHTFHADAPEPPKSYPTKEESIRNANNRAAKAEAHVKRLQERVATLEREAVTLRADLKKARLACAAMREHVAQMRDDETAKVNVWVDELKRMHADTLAGMQKSQPRTWKVGDVVSTPEEYKALPVGTTVWGENCAPGEGNHAPMCFWTKEEAGWWRGWLCGASLIFGYSRVIRSLPEVKP